jgi:hypothetical protein
MWPSGLPDGCTYHVRRTQSPQLTSLRTTAMIPRKALISLERFLSE